MPKKKEYATSEAKRRANAKYDSTQAKRLLRMPPELEKIVLENIDGSFNGYILDLIRADLEKKGIDLP